MKVTLKEAVNKFLPDEVDKGLFRYYLEKSLSNTKSEDIELEEGEVVEIQYGFVTVCFAWDMISAVNNITNEYVDLTTPENAFIVFN